MIETKRNILLKKISSLESALEKGEGEFINTWYGNRKDSTIALNNFKKELKEIEGLKDTPYEGNKLQVESFKKKIHELMNQDYESFVIALGQVEGVMLTPQQYDSWLKSDNSLLNDKLINGGL